MFRSFFLSPSPIQHIANNTRGKEEGADTGSVITCLDCYVLRSLRPKFFQSCMLSLAEAEHDGVAGFKVLLNKTGLQTDRSNLNFGPSSGTLPFRTKISEPYSSPWTFCHGKEDFVSKTTTTGSCLHLGETRSNSGSF